MYVSAVRIIVAMMIATTDILFSSQTLTFLAGAAFLADCLDGVLAILENVVDKSRVTNGYDNLSRERVFMRGSVDVVRDEGVHDDER